MSMDNHVKRGHPIIFGFIVFFSIIELAISAWLTSRFNSHHNYRSTTERDRVRFALFTSVWTIFFGLMYMILFLHSATGSVLTSVASHLVFLAITWILWVAVAASVTEMIGGTLNCSTQNLFVYCGQLNALEAFAWITWIFVTFALVIVLIRGISAARRGDGYGGGLIA